MHGGRAHSARTESAMRASGDRSGGVGGEARWSAPAEVTGGD